MTDSDDVVADIYAKIERERKLITGAMQMSKSTDNPGVQAQADNTIREARRNINYLEETLHSLQIRRMGQGVSNMSVGNSGPQQAPNQNGRPGQPYMGQQQPTGMRQAPGNPYSPQSLGYGVAANMAGREIPDYGEGGYSDTRNDRSGPPRAPFPPGAPGSPRTAARPTYSRLDLIKYDTTHLGPKIQLMLSQLEFKLSVEKQYKDGIEKIMGSYKIDGDKKIRKEAEGRRIESVQKIELLKRALKRYEDLHVDVDLSAETADDDSLNAPSMRKPLTGALTLRIHAVSDVNHASTTSRFGSAKAPETFVIIKVEDEFKARTKATRTERWTDELHEIDIDKGNEVELTVYDKAGDHPMPIGMLWIRISDIAEEIRRKRIETELQHSGWVPAANAMEDGRPAGSNMQFGPPPGHGLGGGATTIGGPQYGSNAPQPQIGPVVIDSWFQLEPVGRIQLSMSFAKQTRERQHFDVGLNRKGAIRQRKEDVHELYGHKFVAQQFYNIMRCALCGELLKYATGMQCADCRYMCHEKCYPLVVTKCITKSNAESDPDEAKLNHRIPHRFEAYGNIGANWCCHCGYILPLGRKSCKRCKDFCGMSMKDANKILKEIKDATTKQGMTKTLRPHPPRPKQHSHTSQTSMDRPAVGNKDRVSYTEDAEDQLYASPQYQTPAAARNPAGGVSAARRRIGLDHFNFLAVLGKGNFGKVMLAETKASKKLYAIKVLKKEFIIENDEVESTRSERDVFIIANKARHPFLLNLHACFQTETRVYFVMEYISGGDLMLHIQRGQFDMYYGSTTRTFCGTPEFMAPEILLDRPYGRAVDWWAFGVLIYQMLLQQSPFRGEDEDEIYDAILADEPLYPIHMPRDSVSILQKLLTREPELRLGSGPTDAQEIMSHAFFRNINWEDIANKRVPSPFLPSIKSATDTSNFDSEFTSVTPVLTPVQSGGKTWQQGTTASCSGRKRPAKLHPTRASRIEGGKEGQRHHGSEKQFRFCAE
ncbi:hypothetical protein FH972_026064 [Carpinus fangiana]|uniref:protein kinase C n=1 Tax=Carpinus fangiana TaxID=176857 RepID=A0A5N6L2X6_9ROSI|nr:hypothetical protein FH972_026064 [Carpinus fangiana]